MNRQNMAVRLAETLLKRYPNPDDYPWKSWSYPQGYLMIGMAKLYDATGDERYFEYVRRYCDGHVNEEGELPAFTGDSMDDMMAGAAIVYLYTMTGERKYQLAAERIRRAFDDYPRTREGGFLHSRNQLPGEMWVDGVFMGQMFLCRYGAAFGEPACFEEAIRQLRLVYRYCHRADGLLAHGYSEDCLATWARPDGQSGEVWSEGLGWYALILAESLDLIPEGFPGREDVVAQYAQLLRGLKRAQGEGGLWFQVVDKGSDPDNWCDTSGSAMFLYSIKRAMETGVVDETEFAPVCERAYQGLIGRASVGEDGGIDIDTACEGLCVQQSYEDYLNYPRKRNAQEAVCGYLWAMTIMEK